MNAIIAILNSFVGPAVIAKPRQSRLEALQPTPDTSGYIDLDRFLCC